MNMLTPALLYFDAVAQEGTLTEAATKLHVSASAISRQINKLETSLGMPLFHRHARGVELTEAGRLLLAYVRRAEAEGAAVREELLVSMQRKTRTLRVACAEGFARVWVPSAIAGLSRQHDDVEFHLDVVSSSEGTRRVAEGEADVAVVFSLGPQAKVTVEHSTPTPVAFALVSPDHQLAAEQTTTLKDLCRYKLAVTAPGSSQRELFDLAMQIEGLTPSITLQSDHINPVIQFARSGVGVSLVGGLSLDRRDREELVTVHLDHPVLRQRHGQIQTMTGRTQPAILTAFVDALIDALELLA
ncbi:DNA-binding transcriptional LysR family regulator [Arthrobacter sp. SORGH_AS 212]|uniref:LysR family transcriptional regulator n=1 Tax=Pseudarthrobacter sp. SORGH_AS 212 TaxID=3041777 RepID=UPI0027812116|nr:DNA-binding transcriptional LysR family regulator [Arthrobacter sp. SORGH_AS_0212]